MSPRAALNACLRLLLSLLLVCAMVVQPALAAACDLNDARVALGVDAGTETIALAGSSDDRSTGDCCGGRTCGHCCLQLMAPVPVRVQVGVALPQSTAMSALAIWHTPTHYPVSQRPPIRN